MGTHFLEAEFPLLMLDLDIKSSVHTAQSIDIFKPGPDFWSYFILQFCLNRSKFTLIETMYRVWKLRTDLYKICTNFWSGLYDRLFRGGQVYMIGCLEVVRCISPTVKKWSGVYHRLFRGGQVYMTHC